MAGKIRQDGSILTHCLVSFYCLYLQWTALSSSLDKDCNRNYGQRSNSLWQILLGLLFTAFALLFYGGNQPTDDVVEIKEQSDSDEHVKAAHSRQQAPLINRDPQDDSDEDEKGKGSKGKQTFVFSISSATIHFQLAMMLSSIYYSMLCTNWLNPSLFHHQAPSDEGVYWLKLGCLWASVAVYFYSLLAPVLLEGRNFD